MSNGEEPDYQDKGHDLTERIRAIEEEKSTTTLTSKLFTAATDFFKEHHDKEKGYITWENDEQKKGFSDSLWETAAEHIAKVYLEMNDALIAAMKALPNVDGVSQWENMMSTYMGGVNKRAFFEQIKSLKEMRPETLVQYYVLPLVGAHVDTRKSNLYTSEIDTNEKAQEVHRYISDVIQHNPLTFKGIEPPEFDGAEKTARFYLKMVKDIPHAYHPKKPETHEEKEDPS